MTITINQREYNVKASMRAMLKYEEQTGKSFAVSTLTDQVNFFYACVCAYNENPLSKEELIDAIDEDSSIFTEFGKLLMDSTTEESEEKKS